MSQIQLNGLADRLNKVIREGFAELARSIKHAAEPLPDDVAEAPDPAHELETARHVMRMGAAKQFMAALVVNHADWTTAQIKAYAFELADTYVAEALTPATPPTTE